MTSAWDIYKYLDYNYPVSSQEKFDNAGFLFGEKYSEVNKVLLTLDITVKTVEEAKKKNCQLIISHHPVIFHKLGSILTDDAVGKRVLALAASDLSAICMHTNLDKADGGVNDLLIRMLGSKISEKCERNPFLRIGYLENPLPMQDYLIYCKDILRTNGIRYYDSGKEVHKIACLGGAGADALYDVYALGCDTFITSDINYHSFLDAREISINLIDGDHFCTENPVMHYLRKKLAEEFRDVHFEVSEEHSQIIQFI